MYCTRLLALIALVGFTTTVAAELPSESLLPGERQRPAELPSESTLPTYAAWQEPVRAGGENQAEAQILDERASEAREVEKPFPPSSEVKSAASPKPPRTLPTEQQVPNPQGSDIAAAAADNGLPIKGSPDGIPWLRINAAGHTAPLRAITFSPDGGRLTTAGDDKALVVWGKAPAAGGGQERWAYERTVRWQIQRGSRGRIYALAAAPDTVAMAGEGAMGGAGEILLIDPASGELAGVLNDLDRGHRQVVVALSFGPAKQSKSLASLSLDGTLVHWSQNAAGLWQAARLAEPDRDRFGGGAQLAQRLLARRALSAVAAINERTVIAPTYARTQNNRVVWRLQRYDVGTGQSAPLNANEQDAPHWDFVTSMVADQGGRRLASADGGGYVYLWDLTTTPPKVHRFPSRSTQVLSMAFDGAGRTLVLGGAVSPSTRRAVIEVWNVADLAAPKRIANFESDQPVVACSVSSDGQTVAWTSGAAAHVHRLSGGAAQALAAGVRRPGKIAFPAEAPFYRLGFNKPVAGGDAGTIDHVFDTSALRLDRLNGAETTKWLPENWLNKGWQVRQVAEADGRMTLWLYEGETRRAQLPIAEIQDGEFRVVCWIPGRGANAQPYAAAIGTSSGEIFLFRLAENGTAPIVRRFRGHWAQVMSLAVSLDLRYLASASHDGTLAVWPLEELATSDELAQRWGADFVVSDGQLVANSVRPNGPTYFRGIRNGDRITEIRYMVGDDEHIESDPHEMRSALVRCDWRTLMTFRYTRGRGAEQAFQIVPAWQQLASLYVADNGEWAYWTPAGYYDASFEGHKHFGWQINRGLQILPDFFLAAQFRRQLERPGAMSNLLRTGNLEAAFQGARLEPPANSPDALVNSYRLMPTVKILSPRDGESVSGQVKVVAEMSTDAAERLTTPRAFANGVPARERRLISERVEGDRRHYTYEWDIRLPSDPRLLLQVATATENEVTGGDQVVVNHQAPEPTAAPRLFLLSVGVNGYRDTQIPKLRTAVETTNDFRNLLNDRATPIYQLSAASLVEERATKPSWRALTDVYASQLASGVSPDDVLVILLSGHGVQAPDDGGYQFITADARYADVLSGRYGDCLSTTDLSVFADVPCRKIVILNTCHGGATQPLMHRELKTAVRDLQDGLVLTLAASGGEQEAVEGRFAKRLMEGLGGAADGDGNGVVSFRETVAYVERTVSADSSGEQVRQTPSAGPKELLRYADIPLTATGKKVTLLDE
jgi:WD40 repeat protein